MSIEVGECGIDYRIIHRPHGWRFSGFRPAALKPGHGREPLMHDGWDHFLRRGPLKDPPDAANPLVHKRPAPSTLNHLGANCLESQWAELTGGLVAVQSSHEAIGELVLVYLVSLRPIGAAIMLLGVDEMSGHHLVDRDITVWPVVCAGRVFGDEAFVLGVCLVGPPRPEDELLPSTVHPHVEDCAAFVFSGDWYGFSRA
jgi:hypothetical protein